MEGRPPDVERWKQRKGLKRAHLTWKNQSYKSLNSMSMESRPFLSYIWLQYAVCQSEPFKECASFLTRNIVLRMGDWWDNLWRAEQVLKTWQKWDVANFSWEKVVKLWDKAEKGVDLEDTLSIANYMRKIERIREMESENGARLKAIEIKLFLEFNCKVDDTLSVRGKLTIEKFGHRLDKREVFFEYFENMSCNISIEMRKRRMKVYSQWKCH